MIHLTMLPSLLRNAFTNISNPTPLPIKHVRLTTGTDAGHMGVGAAEILAQFIKTKWRQTV